MPWRRWKTESEHFDPALHGAQHEMLDHLNPRTEGTPMKRLSQEFHRFWLALDDEMEALGLAPVDYIEALEMFETGLEPMTCALIASLYPTSLETFTEARI